MREQAKGRKAKLSNKKTLKASRGKRVFQPRSPDPTPEEIWGDGINPGLAFLCRDQVQQYWVDADGICRYEFEPPYEGPRASLVLPSGRVM